MNDCSSDSQIQTVEVPQTGAIISRSVYYYDREGNRLGPRCSASRSGPAARAVRSPHGQYDPRIEFILMRSGRRLGVEYRRFVNGKLALIGFVRSLGPPTTIRTARARSKNSTSLTPWASRKPAWNRWRNSRSKRSPRKTRKHAKRRITPDCGAHAKGTKCAQKRAEPDDGRGLRGRSARALPLRAGGAGAGLRRRQRRKRRRLLLLLEPVRRPGDGAGRLDVAARQRRRGGNRRPGQPGLRLLRAVDLTKQFVLSTGVYLRRRLARPVESPSAFQER